MSEENIKIVKCDMCGAEIDFRDDWTIRNSAYSSDFYGVLVQEYNEFFDEEYRTGISFHKLDLCPACADKAAAIRCEIVPTDDGRRRKCEYSWRQAQ